MCHRWISDSPVACRLRAAITLLTLFGHFQCPVFALAEESHAAAAEAQSRVISFTVYSQKRLRGVFFRDSSGAEQELRFFSASRSRSYRTSASGFLQFYRKSDSDEVALIARVEVASLPATALLVFSPVAQNGGPTLYEIRALDDRVDAFPIQHLRILNVSGLDLRVHLADVPIPLPPGSASPPIAVSAEVAIDVRTVAGKPAFREQHFFLGNGERVLLVLFPPYLPGSVEVQPHFLRQDLAAP